MSGISKRISGSWASGDYGIMKTDTDTLTTLPADIYANDTTATVGLKGQATQSGTPTPDSPIMPQSCGERTGNLLSEKYENRSINGLGAFVVDNKFDLLIGEVVAGQIYTISNMNFVYGFFTAKPLPNTGVTYDDSRGYESSETAVVTVPSGCTWIAVRVLHNADNAMLNTGSTALPYEPYGIKIPISSANTTTPVYLGEVESTRRIKKLVLTGKEEYMQYGGGTGVGLLITVEDMRTPSSFAQRTDGYCTHFVPTAAPSGATGNNITFGTSSNIIYIILSAASQQALNVTTYDEFKAWIAAQYAAGTPVTVWYVLATPTTGIVNEPLMRIGDYADTVSNITIPVTAGGDTLSVGTTVQPSEVTVNYKGWHPVQNVHERESGEWT